MKCPRCSSEIPSGFRFCTRCGEAITQAAKAEAKRSAEAVASRPGVYKWAVAAALAALGVTALLIFLLVIGLSANAAQTPQEFYRSAELKNLDRLSSSASGVYSRVDGPVGIMGSVELAVSEKFIAIIADNLGGYEGELPSTAGFEYEAVIRGGRAGIFLSALIDGEPLLSAETVTDAEGGMAYLRVPQLSDMFLALDVTDSLAMLADSPIADMLDAMGKAAPDDETAGRLTRKYLEIIINSLENVKLEAAEVTASGVTAEMTAVTVTLDARTVINIARNVLREVIRDEELKALLNDLSEAYAEEFDYEFDPDYEPGGEGAPEEYDFYGELEEALNSLDSLDRDAIANAMNNTVQMVVWVDGEGNIAGREFVIDADGTGIRLRALCVTSGDDIGVETYLRELEGETVRTHFEATGAFSAAGGKLSGLLSVRAGDYDYDWDSFDFDNYDPYYDYDRYLIWTERDICTVTVEGLDVAKLERGWLSGSFTFTPAPELYGAEDAADSVAIKLDVDSGEGYISLRAALLSGGDELFALSVSSESIAEPREVMIPENTLSPDEWVQSLDLEKLLELFLYTGAYPEG